MYRPNIKVRFYHVSNSLNFFILELPVDIFEKIKSKEIPMCINFYGIGKAVITLTGTYSMEDDDYKLSYGWVS